MSEKVVFIGDGLNMDSRTGLPKVTQLILAGVLKPEDIDPKTGLPKQKSIGQWIKKKVLRRQPDGRQALVEVKVSAGRAVDKDNPDWRIGYSAEKYFNALKREQELKERGTPDTIAVQELMDSEVKSFTAWLTEKTKDEDFDVPDHPVLKEYMKVIKRNAEKKKKPAKTE